MKLSEVIKAVDTSAIAKYGADLFLTSTLAILESPICHARFSINENLPHGIRIKYAAIKTAVAYLGDDCILSFNSPELLLRSGRAKIKLPATEEEAQQTDLPIIEDAPDNAVLIDAPLLDKIEKCAPYSSMEASNPGLCAIYLRGGWVEACNRTCFIRMEHTGADGYSLHNTITCPMVISLAKTTPCTLWQDKEHGDTYVVSKEFSCRIPQIMTAEEGMPAIDKISGNFSEESPAFFPPAVVFEHIREMVGVCDGLGTKADFSVKIAPQDSRVILSIDSPASQITKTIAWKEASPVTPTSIHKNFAPLLPSFLSEKATATILKTPEKSDIALLLIEDEKYSLQFFLPISGVL